MPRFRDLTGQKFNRLLALEPTEKRSNGSVVWKCQCDCGNICYIDASSLTKERTKSCGCLKKEKDRAPKGNAKDEIGNIYGKLKVLERAGSASNGQALWLCECSCENHTKLIVTGSNLRRGHTVSCGCERRSHGEIKVGELLLKNNISFETEKSFFNYDNGHRAPFDFYVNQQYLIEYDGETHDPDFANKHGWLTDESIQKQLQKDEIKNQWCKENNIPLIRIPYTRLKNLTIEDLKLETTKFRVV